MHIRGGDGRDLDRAILVIRFQPPAHGIEQHLQGAGRWVRMGHDLPNNETAAALANGRARKSPSWETLYGELGRLGKRNFS
jgi:hypothetical protein